MLKLVAVSVFASAAIVASSDVEAPGFWNASYTIPRVNCMVRARIVVTDPAIVARRLADWSRGHTTRAHENFIGRNHAVVDWDEPEDRADATKRLVLGLGDVEQYDEQHATGVNELRGNIEHKRQGLEKERDSVNAIRPPLQALPGVITAELRMLDMFVDMMDYAERNRRWLILLVSPDWKAPDAPAQVGKDTSPPILTNMEDGSPWRRQSTPACDYSSATVVEIPADSVENSKAELSLRGGDYVSDGCDFQRSLPFDRVAWAGWVDPFRLQDVRAHWNKTGHANSWRTIAPDRVRSLALADDQKRAILAQDLAEGAESLASLPISRSLAAAELARLEPFATNAEHARRLVLVYLVTR